MANLDKKKIIGGGIFGVIVIVIIVLYFCFFKTYTVTYTLKIGAGIQAEQVKKGDLVTEPTTPTADGYEFLGWYVDGQKYDFNTPVTHDLNLEAKWQKIDN